MRLFKIINSYGQEELVIGSILDEFSYTVFKPECNLIYLSPENFYNLLPSKKIHLLFVESFWEGVDKKWRNSEGEGTSKISILKRIIKYYKERKVPTVFWNKEDPVHFDRFIEIAKLFDYVFTTDENCVKAYIKLLGHERVYTLPFAAQPIIHNPIGRYDERLGKIAFAGSWHSFSHMERKQDMNIILKPAFKYGLAIYDRNYYRDNEALRFPKEYEPYIKGGLTYEETVEIYKKYDIFLNVNSVQNSPTMFSRRVFEILACGTNIVSGYAKGIENMFPDIVFLCRTAEETREAIEKLLKHSSLRDRLSLLGQRQVLKHNTYRHRLAYILDKIGMRYTCDEIGGVSIITWAESLGDLERIIENFNRQLYELKEIIIIAIGIEKPESVFNNNIKVIPAVEYGSIEDCIYEAVNRAVYNYISFFHPRAYYGAEFIGDLMNASLYAKADVIGKKTYYAYENNSNKLYIVHPGNEYKFTQFINAYASIIKKPSFNKVRFKFNKNEALGSEMIIEGDIKIYSTDRFNFALEIKPISKAGASHDIIEVGALNQYETAVTV